MKTSKKILIAFLSVVCLSLLSVMITIENPRSRHFDFENVEKELPNFKVIVIQEGARVGLNTNDSCSIKYSHEKDSSIVKPYQVLNDTLILKPVKIGRGNIQYKITVKNIDKIIIEGGVVSINLQQDSIRIINKKKGNLNILRNNSLSYLELIASEESRSNIYTDKINKLEMRLNNADVFSDKRIASVNLNAENKSSITLQHVKQLVANCDSSSRFRIYQ